MKAIILAAGRGSRMGERTKQLPKCMLKLKGRTLLDRCLDSLQKAGLTQHQIGLVTGYRHEKIPIYDVTYFNNSRWEETNMFVSLTMAREWLLSEPCIVCYSDIVFHENAVIKLINCQRELAITYYTGFGDLWSARFENPLDDLETFKLCGDIMREIGGKPESMCDVQGQYMGLLRFEPSGWRKVEEVTKALSQKEMDKMDMTTLLQRLIVRGYEITAIPTDELWLECDNQDDIALYETRYSF